MSESISAAHSIEPTPSLQQRRARCRAELQEIFRHERDRVPHSVRVMEGDLILACALRKYPPQLASQIKYELQKKRLLRDDTSRPLTRENLIELGKSIQTALRRPNIRETYSSLADALAEGITSRIKINDLTRHDPHTAQPLNL